MPTVISILAGVYIVAMSCFLKTTPGESGPYPPGDERVKREATPVKRILVILLGLLLLTYGVFQVVEARKHPEHAGNGGARHAVPAQIRA